MSGTAKGEPQERWTEHGVSELSAWRASNPDAYGNPQTIIEPSGYQQTRIFDPFGNKLSETKTWINVISSSVEIPTNAVTAYQYDNWDRLIRITHPDGKFRSFQYDFNGNLTKETDENGNYGCCEQEGTVHCVAISG